MFKTFIIGLLLGIVAAAAAVVYVPVVDQHREASVTTVNPNGGVSETFHINIPMDRVMVGSPALRQSVPAGLQWPDDEQLGSLRSDLFKIRNERDTVIGVASRMASNDKQLGGIVEWVLHFPARGSLHVTMQDKADEDGYRPGLIRSGSVEFEDLTGRVTERWIAGRSEADDTSAGRIELVAQFVGLEEEL